MWLTISFILLLFLFLFLARATAKLYNSIPTMLPRDNIIIVVVVIIIIAAARTQSGSVEASIVLAFSFVVPKANNKQHTLEAPTEPT